LRGYQRNAFIAVGTKPTQKLLEYQDREWWKNVPSVLVFSDPRRPSGEAHANTARRIKSVWVAVTSASDAVRHSQVFGFPELGERKSALLRAKGREVKCGEGSIVFGNRQTLSRNSAT
jgi:hypothetical protein